jgi:hypothetical protein
MNVINNFLHENYDEIPNILLNNQIHSLAHKSY